MGDRKLLLLEYGLLIKSISITLELVRKAKSRAHPRLVELASEFQQDPWCFPCMLKLEKQ